MKKILITGANSYIGTSFEAYLKAHYVDDYIVDTIDMMTGSWEDKSFAGYDSVFHVAGIAHADNREISEEKKKLYYSINTDLAIQTAVKAKNDGVKQFVFMSSAIVYGDSAPIGESKLITKDTLPAPDNCYGDSKLQAEIALLKLNEESFKVVIIRSPMIYGEGCRGNYPLLVKIAVKCPLFPYVNNQRSMLYIDNLCEFVRLLICNEEKGIFWPQNREYSNTSELVKLIAKCHGKRIVIIYGLESMLKKIGCKIPIINKAFGSLIYEQEISVYKEEYRIHCLTDSIELTERKKI